MSLTKIYESLLKEYVGADVLDLKTYLSRPLEEKVLELPDIFGYKYFADFLDESQTDFQLPTDPDDEDLSVFYSHDDPQFEHWLKENHPDLYKAYCMYIYTRMDNDRIEVDWDEPETTYAYWPAWFFFKDHVQVIENQWLIHFTSKEDALQIAKNGFTLGVNNKTRIGLTTKVDDIEKVHGGFNFAYTLDEYESFIYIFEGYSFRYGDGSMVLFRGSGIRVWHRGDNEPQVIFWGNKATNIVPIIQDKERHDYNVYNVKTGKTVYKNSEITQTVDWVIRNYEQYRKKIQPRVK